MNASEMAVLAAKALDAKRAKDIVALKVDEMTVITDYMVIATGRSVPQVKALAEHVEEELAKQDLFARRREGMTEGRWCVLDYGDLMVHIFHEQDREYYQLERLWSDGTNELSIDYGEQPDKA
ncbi:MAG: ribosome silencing factor [Clostridiales bacterium]|nr:ribosome silencing factor [Clostridiales bacterium]